MPLVRLKVKGQVTIPASVREAIQAREGDLFEVAVSEGAIVLKPREVISRGGESRSGKGVDIASWIGSGKGLFKTPEEVDAFIRAERAQWD